MSRSIKLNNRQDELLKHMAVKETVERNKPITIHKLVKELVDLYLESNKTIAEVRGNVGVSQTSPTTQKQEKER